MINAIRNLLGLGPKTDLGELIDNGAVIIDVRSPGEYASGHVKGSVNIPLDTLKSKLGRFKKDMPVITCCASGMRSGIARSTMQQAGFQKVYNGGSWHSLKKYVQ
jgi:rhodanese-related sulfurtransferase